MKSRFAPFLLAALFLNSVSPVTANPSIEAQCEKKCSGCQGGEGCDIETGTLTIKTTFPPGTTSSQIEEWKKATCPPQDGNSLGSDQQGQPAGVSTSNYSSSGTVFNNISPDQIKREAGKPRQLETPMYLLDYTSTPNGYIRNAYRYSQTSAPDGNGIRPIKAGELPIFSTIYRNPDGDSTTTNGRLEVVHTQKHPQTGGPIVRTVRYTAPRGNPNWKREYFLGDSNSPTALKYREVSIHYITNPDGTAQSREITRDLVTGGGGFVITSDLTVTYAFYKHGDPVKLSETRHTGLGNDLTTTWTYFTDSVDPASFNKPATMRRSDGRWSDTTYQGSLITGILVTKTVTGWLDNPAPAIGTAPDEAANHVVTEIEARHETGTFGSEEKIQGVLVSKTWGERYKTNDGSLVEKSHIETGTATLLETRTSYPDTAASQPVEKGRLKSIQYPDGSVELRTYATQGENRVETVDKGAGSLTGVTSGTRTVSTYTKDDVLIKETITDIASGIELSAREAIMIDQIGKPSRWAHNHDPDDYTETLNGCCGIDSTRTRDGTVTTYTRDALKRPTTETTYGITTTHTYGKTTIGGTDFPTKTTTRTAGSVTVNLGTTVFDHAGNILQRITPDLNGDGTPETTTITQDLTALTTTTTNPDGGTVIETTFADGQPKTLTGTATAPTAWTHATHTEQGGGLLTTTYAGDTSSPRWTKTYQNLAGRTLKTTAPSPSGEIALQTLTYDPTGRPLKTTDADGITTLTAYNAEGEPYRNAIDLNQNGQIDPTDRITETLREIVAESPVGPAVKQQTILFDLSNNPITTSTVYQTIDGLTTRQETLGSTGNTTSIVEPHTARTDGTWTATTTHPDGTKTITTYTNWLPVTTALHESGTGVPPVIQSTSSSYDPLRRPITQTHSRTGPVTTTYAPSGLVASIDDHGRITTFTYDTMGRRTTTTLPDNTTTHTTYWPTGQEKSTHGSQTNPTVKLYSPQGELIELRTYRSANLALAPDETTPGHDTTTWTYNHRGQLTRKQYADGKGTDYTYTPGGRLHTRTWARSITTTYAYNTAGQLTTTDYSDTTPDVTLSYDKLGRQITQTNGHATTTHTYDPATLALDTETITYNLPGQPAFTRTLDRSHDTLSRPTGFDLKNGSTTETQATYQYSPTDGRLSTVADGTHTFTYSYLANSNLLATLTGPAHTVENTYATDRDVLASKENQVGTTTISKYQYTVNALGQRTAVSQVGAAFQGAQGVAWSYDALGQVTTADHSNNPAFSRAYAYDTIGNRLTSGAGVPPAASSTTYTSNNLNQYSQISSSGSSVQSVTPLHDDDGNMTSGQLPTGTAGLVWDAENRLTAAAITGGATVHYLYDAQSRRIARVAGTATTLYLYDGWNPIAEYTGTTLTKTHLWGLDLSGTLQGAGGIGGLLATTNGTGTHFPTYDGNGNVSEYLDTTGTLAAHYEYDPFGNTTAATGPQANTFTHRFSTKPLDPVTGLYYYGYRYYDPQTGRWPSRDPIEEQGGINLYAFVGNDGMNRIDYLGRVSVDIKDMISKGLESRAAEIAAHVDIGYDKFVGLPPIGPIPWAGGGFFNAGITFTLEVSLCCDKEEGDIDVMYTGSISPELYLQWGKTWKWTKHSNGLIRESGRQVQNRGYRDRSGHVDVGEMNECPKELIEFTGWDISWFIRGSIGIGYGAQGSVNVKLAGTTFNSNDVWSRFNAEVSGAWGVAGASIETGLGGFVGITGKIELP